jgi:hydrogenase-4 component B
MVWGLLGVAPVLWALAAGLVLALPRGGVRLWLVAVVAAAGCIALAAAGVVAAGGVATVTLGSWPGLGAGRLRLDAAADYFLVLTGAVGAVLFLARPGVLSRHRGRSPISSLALLLASLELIFVADNGFLFLVGWEGLAMAFFFLVGGGHRRSPEAGSAALWTMGMAKLGGAAVLAAFLCLAAPGGSLDFAGLAAHGPALPAGLATAAFLCALAGFGLKLGMLPLQSWLPRAYPTAPVGAPAFLAAIALNAGAYGLLRLLQLLGPGPVWWGSTVLLLGAVTALAGILYATAQDDLKRLVAYSSVENAGIVLCGIGASMIGRSAHIPLLAGLGMAAALLQLTVHTVAKAGLFVCADAVERHAGTTDMNRLGGLGWRLPGVTAAFALLAATIVGLPPTGGFPSEWLTLETLMQGFRTPGLGARIPIALAGTMLALTAAVAAIAFVKALFATFLGMPRARRPEVPVGRATAWAAGALGLAGLGLGVAVPWVAVPVGRAGAALGVPDVGAAVSAGNLLIQPAFPHFSSISPTELAIVLPLLALLVLGLTRLVRNRAANVVRTPVWASGAMPGDAATQYTATAWSNPVRVVFDTFLRTRRTRETVAAPPGSVRITYASVVPAPVDDWLVLPLARALERAARWTQHLQSGRLGHYLLYLLVVLVTALIVAPLLKLS